MSLPIKTLDQLYPDNSFFCARTTRAVMRWNVVDADALPAYRLDASPAQLLGFAGDMPFFAHEAACTPHALDFLDLCGLAKPKQLHTYRTAQEAAAGAMELIQQGGKLVYNFGVLPELESSGGLLTPLHQYLQLNAKSYLPNLVDASHLPPRELYPVHELGKLRSGSCTGPMFLKVAAAVSNGGGAAVRFCNGSADLDVVIAEFNRRLKPDDTIIIEKDCEPLRSWCVGVAIHDNAVDWLGASIQLFYKPAVQSGNLLSLEDPPAAIRELALDIATKARQSGYRGVAGFDIGEMADGNPKVFDLNFRPNSSTGLLLAGRSALLATGQAIAQTFYLRHNGPLIDIFKIVQREAAAGRIIPGSMFDADTYNSASADPATRSCLDGWILADTGAEATDWTQRITRQL